ncbi:MAG: hypothetical protein KGH59_00335 [Candidatus Micrarchaeota archaeon]|nr:hypothetical protein [Candidatus Micrarchaeota archaeon]MDE1804221.1 hypothetical protein [Candidatus Micrarchaeota archaeon]MDE1846677.1 hypothetical protein [Candidatus Micrarchaeota archaeon]
MEQTHKELTLVVIKPDALEDALDTKIVSYLVEHIATTEIEVINMKLIKLSKQVLEELYLNKGDAHIEKCGRKVEQTLKDLQRPIEKSAQELGREILNIHVNGFEGKDAIVMLLEGVDAVNKMRELKGSTDPAQAAKGTLRSMFPSGMTLVDAYLQKKPLRNRIHIPDNKEEADKDVRTFYPLTAELHKSLRDGQGLGEKLEERQRVSTAQTL